ncbi:D-glycero-beta-D-manno-heptose 1,7-bisphosphate 7-phosphatase [Pontibacterium sp.]|uniref:D-glycero-beta-D-manno-heptose 1,7-bisphosphate 7-phosphatase n=1 Tax=Pontibacterium sp. TaxID=2036026 RepID=UPI0035191B69
MKLVILDRDGVINEDSDAYVKSVDEWIPLPGSADAIAKLTQSGYTVAVATNQSGLARGYFSQHDLDAMHEKMLALIKEKGGKIAHIAWCPHGPDDNCNCRKPLPGMINEIRDTLSVPDDTICWMIGDSLRDLQAGAVANCRTILVKTGKGMRTLEDTSNALPVGSHICMDLADAVKLILATD